MIREGYLIQFVLVWTLMFGILITRNTRIQKIMILMQFSLLIEVLIQRFLLV